MRRNSLPSAQSLALTIRGRLASGGVLTTGKTFSEALDGAVEGAKAKDRLLLDSIGPKSTTAPLAKESATPAPNPLSVPTSSKPPAVVIPDLASAAPPVPADLSSPVRELAVATADLAEPKTAVALPTPAPKPAPAAVSSPVPASKPAPKFWKWKKKRPAHSGSTTATTGAAKTLRPPRKCARRATGGSFAGCRRCTSTRQAVSAGVNNTGKTDAYH